jgi:PAP2 superfamily.
MSVETQSGARRAVFRDAWQSRAVAEVLAELKRDRPFYLATAAYLAAAVGLAIVLGKADHLVIFSYLAIWIRSAVVLGVLVVVILDLPGSIAASPASPLTQLVSRMRDRITPRLVAGALLFSSMALFYGAFTTVKSLLPSLVPFAWDVRLAGLDAWLHGGHDPWRLLQPLLGHNLVTRVFQVLYLPGWTLSLFAFTGLVAVSRRLAAVRAQFFWTYLLLWPLLGNLVAGAVMTAGPVYYGLVTGDEGRFEDLMAYLSFSQGLPLSSFDVQRDLWAAYTHGLSTMGSGISAFPSMHVAMATLFALVARRMHPRLAIAFAGFALLILAGSVHLGWHYAVDGYASALVTLGVWHGVGFCLRRATVAAEVASV